jgi:hypothetical protein
METKREERGRRMGMGKWEMIWGCEWEYVKKLGAAITDIEDKRTFWETLKRLKEEKPSLSIYELYPKSECATTRARNECVEFVMGLSRGKRDEGESA